MLPNNWAAKRSTQWIVFCTAILAGLALSKTGQTITQIQLVTICTAAASAIYRRRAFSIILLAVLGLGVGLYRGHSFIRTTFPYQYSWNNVVSIEAIATSDTYYENNQPSFDVESVLLGGERTSVPGKGTIRAQGSSIVYRGDRIFATGKLYQTRGSKQFGLSYAQVSVLRTEQTLVNETRQAFTKAVYDALPEPHASFGLGLLVGQRTCLPDGVTHDLSEAGLTHIVAVSGYNLTIIIDAIRRLFGKRSKYQTVLASLFLMAWFILVTGFSASIVRAAFVSILGLWAWYYGRSIQPVLLIVFVAALTGLWYPFYVWSDIGWYLSFLAFFGVLVIAPLWDKRREQLGKRTTLVGQVARETLAAQVMTIPIVMFIFGRVSIIGLLANLLVVPLVPLAMLLTTMAAALTMALSSAGGFAAVPAKLLLGYILDIAHVLGSWRYATRPQATDVIGMITMYCCIGIYASLLWRKVRRNARITDEKR